MHGEKKQHIVSAAIEYMREQSLTQADVSKMAGVPAAYLSNMLNGKHSITTGNGETEIADKYWVGLAGAVGYSIDTVYWEHVMTSQFKRIIVELTAAKETGGTRTIIGPTGSGKTYAVREFAKRNPQHTYVVTVNNLMTVGDVINALVNLLGVPATASRAMRLTAIIVKLKDLSRAGRKPIVIFDEGENMEANTMRMLKGLYDGIHKYCGVALIGTERLMYKMERAKAADKDGGPQFFRRFKTGIKQLSSIDTKYTDFLEHYNLPAGLCKLLRRLCDNYGELHDYLEPAMREAALQGVPLTEQFFRVMYNMPE